MKQMLYMILDMMRFWRCQFGKYALLLLCALLASCSGERCIEADDFGHASFTVPARYKSSQLVSQSGNLQIAHWLSSGYSTNGDPLYIIVRSWDYDVDDNSPESVSAWCPWYGSSETESSNGSKIAQICANFAECTFPLDETCSRGRYSNVENAPCLMKHGIGLYGLVYPKGQTPNTSVDSISSPEGITFHVHTQDAQKAYLGDRAFQHLNRKGQFRNGNGILYKYSDDDLSNYQYMVNGNGNLYFKILDNFYDENSGQYKLIIKNGVTNNNFDPLRLAQKLVLELLLGQDPEAAYDSGDSENKVEASKGLVPSLYQSAITHPTYKNTIKIVLVLYITYMAASYLAGMTDMKIFQIITHLWKIAIISVLINSETSWKFFYNYLFVYFLQGTSEIMTLIQNSVSGPGDNNILAFMLAPQTLKKLYSLLFVDWLGWLYIILYWIALSYLAKIYIASGVIIISCMIITGMIVVMAPVFICFMLFETTKSFYTNWLRQLTSYAVQPIILCTGLVFISTILRNEMYSSLGFAVCRQPLFKMSDTSIYTDSAAKEMDDDMQFTLFSWWYPSPFKKEDFLQKTEEILVPIGHLDPATKQWCRAYECVEQRYPDLPFLDPNNPSDKRRLDEFHDGNFIQFTGLFIIFIALFLLDKFNDVAASIARQLTGTSMNAMSLGGVANAMSEPLFNQAGAFARNPIKYSKGVGRSIANVGGRFSKRVGLNYLGQLVANSRVGKKISANVSKNLNKDWKVTKGALGKFFIPKPKSLLGRGVLKAARFTGRVIALPTALTWKITKGGYKIAKAVPNAKQALHAARTAMDVNKMIDNMRINKLKNEALSDKQNKLVADRVRRNTGIDLSKLDLSAEKKYQEALVKVVGDDKVASALASRSLDGVKDALAQKLHGKDFASISDEQKADINKKLSEVALLRKDVDSLRDYQKSYVKAYAQMSDEGSGAVGKKFAALSKFHEFTNRVSAVQKQQEMDRVNNAASFLRGYEAVKEKASLGIVKNAWNDIDTNPNSGNYSLLTHAEKLELNKQAVKHEKLMAQLDVYSQHAGTSVMDPEFLSSVADEHKPHLDSMIKQDISWRVQQALSAGTDPAFLGDKYLQKYASQQEMKDTINKIHDIGQEMIKNDMFLKRQEKYISKLEGAKSMLNDPNLSQELRAKAEASVKENSEILAKIDERKKIFTAEIESNINRVNQHMNKIYKTTYNKDES